MLAHVKSATIQGAYPKTINWDINIPSINMLRLIDEAIVKYADRPAIDFMDKKITYSEFGALVNKAAKGLQQSGITKGDKIGLYMPNTPYYPIMFFAALRAGATVVNFSPLYTESELRTQIKDSGTKMLISTELKEFYSKAVKLQKHGDIEKVVHCPIYEMLPGIKSLAYRFLKCSQTLPNYKGDNENFIKFSDLIENDGLYNNVAIDPSAPAVLQYTGGTTGLPKGAVLSHFNLVANAHQIEQYFGRNPNSPADSRALQQGQEKVIATIPYFHVFGMMVAMIGSMKIGGELIILPNPRDIKQTLKTIDKKKPTLFPAVPRILQAMTEHPDINKYDLTSLNNVISGGAALPGGVKDTFEKATGKEGVIIQGYGLSETSPVAASNPPEGRPNRADTVGMPYPGTEIKIANPNNPNETYPIGEVGEICIRGPQVMQGYYNKPEETAEILTDDGWFLTGDLGFLDEDMYLKIVDRKKRLIIVNGHNAYPTQIEDALSKHPSIAEAVVIGVPDERSGEAAKAFIRYNSELDKSQRPNAEALQSFLAESLNKLDIPKFFEVREEELPKTSIGKPDFKALEDEEKAKRQTNQHNGQIKPNNTPQP